MHPDLLQGSYPVEYTLNTDNKYPLDEDQSFANPRAFAQHDYPYFTRKSHNGLNNISLGTSSVGANTGLDYNSQSTIPGNTSYPSSQVLLSPPSSIDGSHTGTIQPSSSSFDFSGTSRLLTSNASSTDQFSSVINQYPDSPWSFAAMTDIRPPKPQLLQPLFPPVSYANPMPSPFPGNSMRMDPITNSTTAPHPRLYSGLSFPDLGSNGPFSKGLPREQHFPNPTSSFPPFPPGHHYPSMPTHQPARPEGPPFDDTKIIFPLVTGRNQPIGPEISASIQKGFFQVEGKWTCYRRNYFAVQCAFSFKNPPHDGQVFLQRGSQLELVQSYAVSLSAKTANLNNQDSEIRQLVQHTPKRDKATESTPGRHPVQPATVQSLPGSTALPNTGLYHGLHHMSAGPLSNYDAFNTSSQQSPPTSYTFERIQFQKATANNGKRRAQQQFFHIIVELSVNVGRVGGDEVWVVIATKQSHPMVVRGRSPGHYKDNVRRDPQTNMDPDRGSGNGGDGGHVCLPGPQFLSGGQSSTMPWASSHRQSHNYGNSYSRHACEPACSPLSAGSSTTLTESPIEGDFRVSALASPKSGISQYARRTMATLPSHHNTYLTPDGDRRYSGTKRPYEDDVEYEHDYYHSNAYAEDSFSPRSFNLTNAPSVKSLCAPS